MKKLMLANVDIVSKIVHRYSLNNHKIFFNNFFNFLKSNSALTLIVLFLGCNTERKQNIYSNHNCSGLVLTTEEIKNNLDFTNLTDTIIAINLETTKHSIFGDIRTLDILNDTIIIFDVDNQRILTFDINGNYLGETGEKGHGPNEYLKIRSITVDRKKRMLLLLDEHLRKIFYYGLNGQLLYHEDVQFLYPWDITSQNDKLFYYLHYNTSAASEKINIKHNLYITSNNQVIQKYFPFSMDAKFRFPLNRVFYELNDTVCFIDRWSAKVYSIADNIIVPRFCVDFMGNEMPVKYTKEENLFRQHEKDYTYLSGVLENNSYIFFRYMQQGEIKRVLYNKINHEYYAFSSEETFNLFSELFYPIYSYNNYFVSIVSPMILIEAQKRNLLDFDKIHIDVSTLEPYDNMVLFFYKFN